MVYHDKHVCMFDLGLYYPFNAWCHMGHNRMCYYELEYVQYYVLLNHNVTEQIINKFSVKKTNKQKTV
jgi:hypothetical protein